MGKEQELELEIREVPGKGRAVYTLAPISKGNSVLEYNTYKVYRREERSTHEQEYEFNGEGCMVLEVETADGWFCLDATRRHNTLGRLLNHSPPPQPCNTQAPQTTESKWKLRVGFYSIRDLASNTELTWDYACPPRGQSWLMRRQRKQVRCGT